ncbi:hypothetical protein FOS14_08665 [Skermania sp. ID1734]|nr:hypothetical protein [Skermania sp. ID1734]TSE00470.1 hypothetical protein FOS14_08665 [Skermania sp. ID1734]
MRILFVCTGNICRSPTAERLADAHAISGLHTESAGIHAVVGHPIETTAAAVLESMGADSKNFSARRFVPAMAKDADLILTMTLEQRASVLSQAPMALRKTFTLTEAASLVESGARTVPELSAARPRIRVPAADILDPIGGDAEVFKATANAIAGSLSTLLSGLAI